MQRPLFAGIVDGVGVSSGAMENLLSTQATEIKLVLQEYFDFVKKFQSVNGMYMNLFCTSITQGVGDLRLRSRMINETFQS